MRDKIQSCLTEKGVSVLSNCFGGSIAIAWGSSREEKPLDKDGLAISLMS